MENKFKQGFGEYVSERDSITADVEGFQVKATVYRDDFAGAPDSRMDGFWPVTGDENKEAAGYVSPEDYDAAHELAQKTMEAWQCDDWFYCGVSLTVSFDGLALTEPFTQALWGIECNYPQPPGVAQNLYLTEVANELLGEALSEAKQKLADVCKKAAALEPRETK